MDRLANPLVSCPFDRLHRVKMSRLQAHIVKCEKRHPGYEACPYNASHRFKPADMLYHVVDCPAREPINPNEIPRKFRAAPAPLYNPRLEDDNDTESWD